MANPPLDAFPEHRLNVRADAMYRIHEVSRLISTYFDQLVSQHGITRAQWTTVMHITQNQGATQTQLADTMQMGRAAAGKMLDRLEEKGWIERRPDPSDHRVRRVYTQSKIQPLHESIPTAAKKLYEEFYAGLSDEQIEQLHETLIVMRDNGRSAINQTGPEKNVT
ncbi:MAG: MarR family transcriptional regulator [Phyllobacteriaceae bacterium]|mgnify:CR=1 FL=1|nr:MarR family transcriptional regulator [Phyllobacteriaceae bacterium]